MTSKRTEKERSIVIKLMALLVASVAIAASTGTSSAKPTPKPTAHAPHVSHHAKCKMKTCPKTQQKGIQP